MPIRRRRRGDAEAVRQALAELIAARVRRHGETPAAARAKVLTSAEGRALLEELETMRDDGARAAKIAKRLSAVLLGDGVSKAGTADEPTLREAAERLGERLARELAAGDPLLSPEVASGRVWKSELGRVLYNLATVPMASAKVSKALAALARDHGDYLAELGELMPKTASPAESELRRLAGEVQRADPSLTPAQATLVIRKRYPHLIALVEAERAAEAD